MHFKFFFRNTGSDGADVMSSGRLFQFNLLCGQCRQLTCAVSDPGFPRFLESHGKLRKLRKEFSGPGKSWKMTGHGKSWNSTNRSWNFLTEG